MQQKNIYIVLTRTTTVLSRLIANVTGKLYTHASISLEKGSPIMYSFGRKRRNNPFIGGFCREDLNRGLFGVCKSLPYAVIQIKVTQEQYDRAGAIINTYIQNAEQYQYNYAGLFFAVIGKAHKCRNGYYCSEFVYDLLSQSEIICEEKPAVIHPQDLMRYGRVIEEGDWRQKKNEKAVSILSELYLILRPLIGKIYT